MHLFRDAVRDLRIARSIMFLESVYSAVRVVLCALCV